VGVIIDSSGQRPHTAYQIGRYEGILLPMIKRGSLELDQRPGKLGMPCFRINEPILTTLPRQGGCERRSCERHAPSITRETYAQPKNESTSFALSMNCCFFV
jgi:hypothetical protein